MSDIHFHVLDSGNREQVACRIAEQAVAQGHRVHIRTADAEASEAMDSLLWVFRDQGFVPHSIGEPDNSHICVSIHDQWLPESRDVLINLADDLPQEFDTFDRIDEMVGPDDASKSSGRQRFREYKDRGVEPKHEVVTSR